MNEQLSAWIDGEIEGAELARVVDLATRQPGQRKACAFCWLIGDILRDEPALQPDFTHRVMAQLEAEATVFAPSSPQVPEIHRLRWMPMAAAAAGAAVAVWMGFSVWGGGSGREIQTIAQRSALPLPPASSKVLTGDRSYLMAHQASAMGVPMAGVAQYIRTVGDEQQASAQ